MTLLIEAGGTKTDVFYTMDQLHTHRFETLHPSGTEQGWQKTIDAIVSHVPFSVEQVLYYGAGTEVTLFVENVTKMLERAFPNAQVLMHSDLALVGHAMLGLEGDGCVGILGTGSNFGMMESGILTQPFPSLGYLMGDEGSGVDIAKRFMQTWTRSGFSSNLEAVLKDKLTDPKSQISRIYGGGKPNTHLAEIVQQLPWWDFQELQEIVLASFRAYFSSFDGVKTSNRVLCLTGGIANHFEPLLQQVASDFNWKIQIADSLAPLFFKAARKNQS